MRDKILKLIDEKGSPPPLPDVLLSLQERVENFDCDLYEITELIEKEPVLAGKLLNLSNSAFMGGGQETIENLNSAVMKVGVKMVMELAYSLKMPSVFQTPETFDHFQFWKHSMIVALLTRSLASKADISVEEREASYLSGLLHDLGILIFIYLIPKEYDRFLNQENIYDHPLEKLEVESFGISHTTLGAEFLKRKWPVSPLVIKAVLGHHGGLPQKGVPLSISHLIWLANQIAYEYEVPNGVASHAHDPIDYDLLADFGWSQEELETEIHAALDKLHSIEGFL